MRVFILLILLLPGLANAKDKLLLVGETWAPFSFEEKGEVIGIDVDVAKAIFKKLGVEVEFKIYKWKRAWFMVQEGEADGSLSTSVKEARKPFVHYPQNHVWSSDYHIFINKDEKKKYKLDTYQSIVDNNLTLGIAQGNSYNEEFWETFKDYKLGDSSEGHKTLRAKKDTEQLLRLLEAKRVDTYVIDKIIGSYTAKRLGLKKIDYYETKPIFSKPYPNVFSKKSKFSSSKYKNIKELVDAYDKELEAFKKSAEYKKIFNKWIGK